MKKTIILLFILLLASEAYANKPYFDLNVAKNATRHNNLGLTRLEDGYYDMAISEFQLAIELNPNSKACAVYYNNLGEALMKTGQYSLAQDAFEQSIKISPLTFLYYRNIVKCYKAQGILNNKINQYKNLEDKNSMYMVMLGLCYIESGNLKRGIIKLDEFCFKEPYLITTPAVKKYIKELTEENY